MDVKFIKTTSSQLSNLPVVNGQLIALTDISGYYYDMGDVRYAVGKVYSPQELGFGYGTCTSAASTVAKRGTLANYILTDGGIVVIAFTNDVHAGDTLNINSQGAKALYYQGAAIASGVINGGDTVTFAYDSSIPAYHVISIDAGTGGGHVIEDSDGTSMTQ